MTKKELIQAIEENNISDDADVVISVQSADKAFTFTVHPNRLLLQDEPAVISISGTLPEAVSFSADDEEEIPDTLRNPLLS